jgi:protein-S-isoprenylcysteine O-methyltransferase Ste14
MVECAGIQGVTVAVPDRRTPLNADPLGGGAMIKPESVITYVGLLAAVASLPIVVRGIRRRGTGEKHESLFWVQRAPQIAVLLNAVLIVAAFELPQKRMVNLFAHLPTEASGLIAWFGVAIYLSGIVFVVGGWYSLGANFSTDAELLTDQSVTNRGLYQVVLHPVYSGVGQALFGAGLASGSLIAVILTALLVAPLGYRRARYEETLLVSQFDEEYRRYAESVGWRRLVPKFIPFGF